MKSILFLAALFVVTFASGLLIGQAAAGTVKDQQCLEAIIYQHTLLEPPAIS